MPYVQGPRAVAQSYVRRDLRCQPELQPVDDTRGQLLADRNIAGNKVYLVHADRDEALEFEHDEPYHAHLRAVMTATRYAKDNH